MIVPKEPEDAFALGAPNCGVLKALKAWIWRLSFCESENGMAKIRLSSNPRGLFYGATTHDGLRGALP